jgi:hypothetical protein
LSGIQKSNLIDWIFFSIKGKAVNHIKPVIIDYSLLIFINYCSDFFILSILWADKNIALFPIDVKFHFYLLVMAGLDIKAIDSWWLNSIWLHIIIVHFILVSACVLSLPYFLSNICINLILPGWFGGEGNS